MTSEQRRKISWLNRAFYADKNARAWTAKLEHDRSLAQRLTRYSDGTGGNSSGNRTEDYLIRLAETERKTQEKLKELVGIREEIIEAIQKLEDSDLQTVLLWRYLEYLTFEQTAEKMHYSERNIRYKHKQALDKLCLVLPDET